MTGVSSTTPTYVPYTVDTEKLESYQPEIGNTLPPTTTTSPAPIPRVSGGGYFTMISLTALGLPTPSSPKDLAAYLAALLAKVDESVEEIQQKAELARNEEVATLLSQYLWLFTLGPLLEGQKADKEIELSTHNSDLSARKEERADLLEEREKLLKKLEDTDNANRKAELNNELEVVNYQLKEVNRSITALQTRISVVTAEIEEVADLISQIDVSFVILLTAIVRERNHVDNESENTESAFLERLNLQITETQSRPIQLGLSLAQQQELLRSIKELQVKLEKDEELALRTTLMILQAVIRQFPVQANGGLLPELPPHMTGGGGRYHMTV